MQRDSIRGLDYIKFFKSFTRGERAAMLAFFVGKNVKFRW